MREVLELYRRVPETPERVSQADEDLARTALQRGVTPDALAHAIRVATIRRHLRDPAARPLAPVRSLAYYLRTLQSLDGEALDSEYVEYVAHRFERLLNDRDGHPPQEPLRHDRNLALLRDR